MALHGSPGGTSRTMRSERPRSYPASLEGAARGTEASRHAGGKPDPGQSKRNRTGRLPIRRVGSPAESSRRRPEARSPDFGHPSRAQRTRRPQSRWPAGRQLGDQPRGRGRSTPRHETRSSAGARQWTGGAHVSTSRVVHSETEPKLLVAAVDIRMWTYSLETVHGAERSTGPVIGGLHDPDSRRSCRSASSSPRSLSPSPPRHLSSISFPNLAQL